MLICECIIYVGDLKGNVNEGQLLICYPTYQKLSLIHISFQITHINDAFENEPPMVNVAVTRATTVPDWAIGEEITASILFFSGKKMKIWTKKSDQRTRDNSSCATCDENENFGRQWNKQT
jgi:hypothetical protein